MIYQDGNNALFLRHDPVHSSRRKPTKHSQVGRADRSVMYLCVLPVDPSSIGFSCTVLSEIKDIISPEIFDSILS